jgi:hypothetical protein
MSNPIKWTKIQSTLKTPSFMVSISNPLLCYPNWFHLFTESIHFTLLWLYPNLFFISASMALPLVCTVSAYQTIMLVFSTTSQLISPNTARVSSFWYPSSISLSGIYTQLIIYDNFNWVLGVIPFASCDRITSEYNIIQTKSFSL